MLPDDELPAGFLYPPLFLRMLENELIELGTPWAENRLLASPTVHAALASLDHLLGAVEGPRTSTEEVREQARARGASVAAAHPGRRRGGSPS